MSRITRFAAVAAATALGAIALAPAAVASDAITVRHDAEPVNVTAFPIGSSVVGPVNAQIESLILDAGNVTAILDTVSLLSWVHGPVTNR